MRTSLPLAAILAAFSSQAAVINWTNTVNGNWNVANNWSPNQVPSTNDTAVITNAGSYTVTLNVDPTIAGLVVGGDAGTQTVSTAQQTLTLNGNGRIGSHGVFNLAVGTLSGANLIELEGVLNWSGGIINSNAAINISTNGTLLIYSAANFVKYMYGHLTNAGTIIWQPHSGLLIGGVLHNLPGALFDAQMDGVIYQGGNGLIVNEGVFRKSVGTGTLSCGVPMINRGAVDAQLGTILLSDGSIFGDGCEFTGAGQTQMNSGTNTISGSIHSENLSVQYNATLNGTGSFSGTLTWGGGNIGTDANITVSTNGTLLIYSAANFVKYMYGHLTNAGTIIWQPHSGLLIGGVLHNLPGALFDAQMDGVIYQGGNGLIVNEGVFRKSVGTGTLSCGVPMINRGAVDAQLGTILLSDGSIFGDGCEFTGAGQTQMNSGTNTISGSIHSENLSVQYNATLNGTGSFSGTLTWGGGNIGTDANITVSTNGTLLISSAANFVKYMYGHLTNAGTIIWQPHSGLLIGGVLHNLPGALFDAQMDGVIYQGGNGLIVNEGVFLKSAGAWSTDCEVPFVNRDTTKVSSGTLDFENSFTNVAGTILVAGGTFKTLQPLWLSSGLLTGWGTVNADVTNAACIRPSCFNGVLTINGKYNQRLDGRIEFELAGNLPGTNQSRLNITGAAALRGTVGVLWGQGIVPLPGTDFPVLTFASHQGEFCCFDHSILLGQGRHLEPVYTATSFTLATVAASEPADIPLRVVVDGSGALVHWPMEFSGYELYWSTNLAQANWTLISGATNRCFELAPLPREKFFRLRAF